MEEERQTDYKYYKYVWETFILSKYISKVNEVFSSYFNLDKKTTEEYVIPHFKFNIRLFVNHKNNDFNYYCKAMISLIQWNILTGINVKDGNVRNETGRLCFGIYKDNDMDTILKSIKISRNYLCQNHLIYYKLPSNVDSDYLDNIQINKISIFIDDIKKFMNMIKNDLVMPLNEMWRDDLDIYLLNK